MLMDISYAFNMISFFKKTLSDSFVKGALWIMLGMDKKSVANNNGRDNYNAESQYLIITSANIDIHELHIYKA